jgi:putative hydrolase of the HAD superfamily
MSITAVAFDIDGTLYPNKSMYLHSIPFFLTHINIIHRFSKVRHDIRKVDSIQDFDSLQADLLARELSIDSSSARDIIENILYSQWEKVFKRVRPFAGVRNVLVTLKKRKIKLAALSDFPVGNKLSYFGLDDLWDTVMASHESGKLKPASEPFLELARRLKTDPSEILYVGNNPLYDVLGSKMAGMKSAYVAPFWKKKNPHADYQFSNYRQFAGILDRILS